MLKSFRNYTQSSLKEEKPSHMMGNMRQGWQWFTRTFERNLAKRGQGSHAGHRFGPTYLYCTIHLFSKFCILLSPVLINTVRSRSFISLITNFIILVHGTTQPNEKTCLHCMFASFYLLDYITCHEAYL